MLWYGQILQQEKAEDFVLATAETHTVREFAEVAFNELGIELEWQGENENEKGVVKSVNNDKLSEIVKSDSAGSSQLSETERLKLDTERLILKADKLLNSVIVSVDPSYYRPTEVDLLIGDSTKAKETFGWEAKTKWNVLAGLMDREDFIKVLKRGF